MDIQLKTINFIQESLHGKNFYKVIVYEADVIFLPQKPIYLDYHATTPTDSRVANLMLHYMTEEFGNASSLDHEYGDRAESAIKQSAQHVADLMGASPREILSTSVWCNREH